MANPVPMHLPECEKRLISSDRNALKPEFLKKKISKQHLRNNPAHSPIKLRSFAPGKGHFR